MNIIYWVILILGVVAIHRNKNLQKLFWKSFGITFIVLYLSYLIFDFSGSPRDNLIGILLLAFILSILFVFIKKWIAERKEIKS